MGTLVFDYRSMTVTILSHHRKISFISYRTGIGCGVILGLVVSKKKKWVASERGFYRGNGAAFPNRCDAYS